MMGKGQCQEIPDHCGPHPPNTRALSIYCLRGPTCVPNTIDLCQWKPALAEDTVYCIISKLGNSRDFTALEDTELYSIIKNNLPNCHCCSGMLMNL